MGIMQKLEWKRVEHVKPQKFESAESFWSRQPVLGCLMKIWHKTEYIKCDAMQWETVAGL